MPNGECSRAVISVKRVLDSCKKQLNFDHAHLTLLNVPADAVEPFCYINATSTQTDAFVTDLTVVRLGDTPCKARVRCRVTIPLQVCFADANGQKYSCKSEITVNEDVILYVPKPSVFPCEIIAVGGCTAATGRFGDRTHCECNACITIITKVITEVDLVVPCYGYAQTPNAVDYEEQTCAQFFDMPLYPQGQ